LGRSLGKEAKLGCLESVSLCHRDFRAIEAIENKFAEEWEAHFSGNVDVLFAFLVHQIDVVAAPVSSDIHVFA